MNKDYLKYYIENPTALDKYNTKEYNERKAFLEGFNPVKTVEKKKKGTDITLRKSESVLKALPVYSGVAKKSYNPDAIEFGADSETYRILQDLSNRWFATSDTAERNRLHGVAEKVRKYHRQGTPIVDRHDEIMNLLHENKKTAQAYQRTMTQGLSGVLYRMSGENYMLDSSTYLIGMVNKGEWDYKYNDDWRVKYDYFDDK